MLPTFKLTIAVMIIVSWGGQLLLAIFAMVMGTNEKMVMMTYGAEVHMMPRKEGLATEANHGCHGQHPRQSDETKGPESIRSHTYALSWRRRHVAPNGGKLLLWFCKRET